MDRALEHNGLKIMILLRLSPLIPYNALDYISGVTSISLWHFSLALIAMLPGTILFCSIGATASSLSDGTRAAKENDQVRFWGMILGILFALAGISLASYYSKIELDRIILMEHEGHASRIDLMNNADGVTDEEEEEDIPDNYRDDVALEEYQRERS
jgi:SNARE associated Golgi protein